MPNNISHCIGINRKLAVVKVDPVSHPNHYCQGGIECKNAIRAALTPEEFRGYIKGNIIKYAWRERFKNGDEDLKKISEYIKILFEEFK